MNDFQTGKEYTRNITKIGNKNRKVKQISLIKYFFPYLHMILIVYNHNIDIEYKIVNTRNKIKIN